MSEEIEVISSPRTPLSTKASASTVPLRFFILTCREESTDFRRPLASVLRDRGFETYYVWLRRWPVVAGPTDADSPRTISFPHFLQFMMNFRSHRNAVNIYVNSTNTSFPLISLMLRLLGAPGIWCLDVHDNLLYDSYGIARLREAIALKVLERGSHILVHAARTLNELFPHSHHLGNASHIRPIFRDVTDFRKVLITASMDNRFDFELMDSASARCPAIEFHIYGQVNKNDSGVRARLQSLCAQRKNIHYHGPYVLTELPGILQSYTVAFAPYDALSPLTRYIDPVRYYHCLNSGMEVVTTPIPQAACLNEALHIIQSADEFAEVLARLQGDPGSRRNTPDRYHLQTWETRVWQLIDILLQLPRMKKLMKLVNAAGLVQSRAVGALEDSDEPRSWH